MIKNATLTDLKEILDIYTRARKYMRDNNNPNQWEDKYPLKEDIIKDIKNNNLYIGIINGKIEFVFAYIIGIDNTYLRIDNGKWINDDKYGTIHKIASSGNYKNIFGEVFSYCNYLNSLYNIENIRIDTHHDNLIMQHVVEKYGFKKCGIIYVRNNSPRIAYQYVK